MFTFLWTMLTSYTPVILFEVMRYTLRIYNLGWRTVKYLVGTPTTSEQRYFLGLDGGIERADLKQVPAGQVFFSEWRSYEGDALTYVRYEGDEIEETFVDPFTLPRAKCPWIWIGDRHSEVDLTHHFNEYLVPGNRIEEDLCRLWAVKREDILYIDGESFEEREIPAEGMTIVEDPHATT